MKLALTPDQQQAIQAIADAGTLRHGDCLIFGQARRIPWNQPDAGQWALHVIATTSTMGDKLRAIIEAERMKASAPTVPRRRKRRDAAPA